MGGPRRNIASGCAVHGDCFTCPLSRCYLEMPDGMDGARREMSAILTDARHEAKVHEHLERATIMLDEGLSVAQAAERWGVTERTVFRYLSRHREHVRDEP